MSILQKILPAALIPLLIAAAPTAPQFAGTLHARLSAGPSKTNVILSPYSVAMAMHLVRLGARGETEAEMARVLGDVPPYLDSGKGYTLKVANRLFTQKGVDFAPAYLTAARDKLHAGAEALDFRAAPDKGRAHINRWVGDQTDRMITDLLPAGSVDASTRVVLVNAVLFKGKWETKFDDKVTRDQDFTLSGGAKVKTPLMHRHGTFAYADTDVGQIIRLPYEGKDLEMIVILPRPKAGADQPIDLAKLDGWLARTAERELDLWLPRFKARYQQTLKDHLTAMGMKRVFAAGADLSGMTRAAGGGLVVDEVYHQAVIEVNEEGTKAAAATAVVVKESAPERPLEFRADRPFTYVIRHRASGAIVFSGRLADPTATK